MGHNEEIEELSEEDELKEFAILLNNDDIEKAKTLWGVSNYEDLGEAINKLVKETIRGKK